MVRLYLKSGRPTSNIFKAYSFSIDLSRKELIPPRLFPSKIKSKANREKFIERLLIQLDLLIFGVVQEAASKKRVRFEYLTQTGIITKKYENARYYSVIFGKKRIIKEKKIPKTVKSKVQKRNYLISVLLKQPAIVLTLLKEEKKPEGLNRFNTNLAHDFPDFSTARKIKLEFNNATSNIIRVEVKSKNSRIYDSSIDFRLYENSKYKTYAKSEVLIYNVKFKKPIILYADKKESFKKIRLLFRKFLNQFYNRMIKANIYGVDIYPRIVIKDKDGEDSGFGVSKMGTNSSKDKIIESVMTEFQNSFTMSYKKNLFVLYLFLSNGFHGDPDELESREKSVVTGFQVVLYLNYKDKNYSQKNLTMERFKSVFAKTYNG